MLREFIQNPTKLNFPKKYSPHSTLPYYEDLSNESLFEKHYRVTLINNKHIGHYKKCFRSGITDIFLKGNICYYTIDIEEVSHNNFTFYFRFEHYFNIQNSNDTLVLENEIIRIKLNIDLKNKLLFCSSNSIERKQHNQNHLSSKEKVPTDLIPIYILHFIEDTFSIWHNWQNVFISRNEIPGYISNVNSINTLEKLINYRYGKQFYFKNCSKFPPQLYHELLEITKTNVKTFLRLYQYILNKQLHLTYWNSPQSKSIEEILIDFYEERCILLCEEGFTPNQRAVVNDYINFNRGNINLKISSYRRILELHDEHLNNLPRGIEFKFKPFSVKGKYDVLKNTTNYTFTYIDTDVKLMKEGEVMKHCVTTYYQRLIDYDCGLYHVDVHGEDIGYTAEIIIKVDGSYECIQLAGQYNCDAPKEVWIEIQLQLAIVNIPNDNN